MFSEEDLDDRVQRFSKPEVPGELVRASHGREKRGGKTGARSNWRASSSDPRGSYIPRSGLDDYLG